MEKNCSLIIVRVEFFSSMKLVFLFCFFVCGFAQDVSMLAPISQSLEKQDGEMVVAGFEDPVFQFPQESVDFPTASQPILFPKKSAQIASGLSLLFPGLGHFYLGDSKTAGKFLGAAAMELGTFGFALNRDQKELAAFSLLTFSNTLNYGIYAAYRDARSFNGQECYHYKMPVDHLADLTSAPFRLSVLKKPEVWGGCLGALAAACCVTYFAFPPESRISPLATLENHRTPPWFPMVALPVGVGEESFFRGFVQSGLSESLGPWGGICATSLLFGAAHIPNASLMPKGERWRYYSFSLPLITSLGLYLGWLTKKNVSLKESVALHTWYDLVLLGTAALTQSAAIGSPTFFWSMGF